MKKFGGLFLVLILLVGILFLSSVHASIDSAGEQLEANVEGLGNKIEGVENFVENPLQTKEELKDKYLKKAWDEILQKDSGPLGMIYRGYLRVSPYSDPVIEFAVGMKPELSWYFLLLLVVWFMVVKYFYTFYEVLRDFSTFSNNTSIVISIGFFIILLVLQFFQNVSKLLADLIVAFIALFDTWWMQTILVFAFVLAVFILAKFSKQIKILARYIRMQNYKRKKEMEDERKKLELDMGLKKIDVIADAFSKPFKE